MKRMPYGISDYKKLITNNYYYVDKTMYLEKLEDMGRTFIYLRPRRFGKTLFTSMMYYYYDINSKNLYDELYKDTYIYRNPTINKNNYYVLKFDFSGMTINENTENSIMDAFKNSLYESVTKFLNYYGFSFEIDKSLNPAEFLASFLVFFESLKLQNKIYLIIDEYDNFTNSILSNNLDMFKNILGNDGFIKAFYAKIKSYAGTVIDRIFITGVCSISLDSMTSGFNIATNITTDFEFNAMTALTHNEVKEIINEIACDKEKTFNEMLENYDGYKFSKRASEKVFNPSLTMYYLSSLAKINMPPEELMDSNIISNYEQIKNIISLGDYKNIITNILDDGLTKSELVYNFDLQTEFNNDDIISLLYYFGYLTIDSGSTNIITFTIPNKVIRQVFNRYFLSIFKSNIDKNILGKCEDEMNEYGNIDGITEYVSGILKESSNRNLINFDEKYIKLMYICLLSIIDNYNVYDEYEVKNGYIDLLLLRKNINAKYDILIEFKYLKKSEEKLFDNVLIEAKEQIDKYILDDRIDKNSLKKYVVMFKNFDYKITEIN